MVGDGVVVFVSARIAAGKRHSFACTHVFVGKRTRGGGCYHITADEACQIHMGRIHCGHDTAVIHAVVGYKARDGQSFLCDVSAGGGLTGDGVVGQVGAAIAAGQVDGTGQACCLSSKHTGG